MPDQPQQHLPPQVIIVKPLKSVGVAIALSFVFGPLGMLYSTIIGAVVMFFVNVFALLLTAGLGFILTWPAGMVWAAMAASNHNKNLLSGTPAAGTNPQS